MAEHSEVFASYASLWREIESADVYLCYRETDRGEAGYFQHDGDAIPPAPHEQAWRRRPKIALCRAPRPEPDDVPTDLAETEALASEVLTLCHEYGHCLSYRGETARATWEGYHQAAVHRDRIEDELPVGKSIPDAMRDGLSGAEKDLILKEETLAWKLGRQHVPAFLLNRYDAITNERIRIVRHNVGIETITE